VISNAIVAVIKHNFEVDYTRESDLRTFIYLLDKLTPIKGFTAPLRKDPIKPGAKRRHNSSKLPMEAEVEIILSDGEVEVVKL
jgi:hypothetical protein